MNAETRESASYLVVSQGREPQQGPLAGGGFRWAQSVKLLRSGVEIASASGFSCTYAGDPICDPVEENARLAEMARPGDRVLVNFSRHGNGGFLREEEWIVASPMGERRAKRPQGCEPLWEDQLVMAAMDRPFVVMRRRWAKAARLAALKAAALSRRWAS